MITITTNPESTETKSDQQFKDKELIESDKEENNKKESPAEDNLEDDDEESEGMNEIIECCKRVEKIIKEKEKRESRAKKEDELNINEIYENILLGKKRKINEKLTDIINKEKESDKDFVYDDIFEFDWRDKNN